MPVIPVVSVVTGPSVWVVPSGFVIVTVTPAHPVCGQAVGFVSPVRINVGCPTPTGLGRAPMIGKVFISAALAVGKTTSVKVIANIRIKAVVVTTRFFNVFMCISFLLFFGFCQDFLTSKPIYYAVHFVFIIFGMCAILGY